MKVGLSAKAKSVAESTSSRLRQLVEGQPQITTLLDAASYIRRHTFEECSRPRSQTWLVRLVVATVTVISPLPYNLPLFVRLLRWLVAGGGIEPPTLGL